MTTPLAVAAFTQTYTNHEPYVTVQEYLDAPSAVNASNLVQGGNLQQNEQQLASTVGRASSIADEIIFGAQGCLAATVNIDGPTAYRVNRYGYVSFRCSYRPVLQINSIQIGYAATGLVTLTPTQASGIVIGQSGVVAIPTFTANSIGPFVPNGFAVGSEVLVVMEYVNGYANAALAETVQASATSIQLSNAAGIYPGTPLTIYDDGAGNEQVTVAASYVIGQTPVPLAAPLQFTHSAGISVSNLPPVVKQAVISLTSALIKSRGNLAIVMNQVRATPGPVQKQDEGAASDAALARQLLLPFKRAR